MATGAVEKFRFSAEKANLPDLGKDKDQNVYPRVEIAVWIHRICRNRVHNEAELTQKLISHVENNNLLYLYKYIAGKGIIEFDQAKFDLMQQKHDIIISTLKQMVEKQIVFDDLGAKEIMNYHSNYLSAIGDREGSLNYLIENYGTCLTYSRKIENYLHRCRIGFFFMDRKLVADSLEMVDGLIKKCSDWHLKNINHAYIALYSLWNRNTKLACINFLSCVSSFSSFDVMSLVTFCSYTAVTALLTLSREKFYQKIINGSEVQEGLYNSPYVSKLSEAFYICDYREFTINLKVVVREMQNDPFCCQHADYLCKQFRLKAYTQLLASFKSLTLAYLSDVFALSQEFIEADIAQFIAQKELNCKIDLVHGMVLISHSDKKNKDFNEFLSQSDHLIETIRFMERTVNE